MLLTGGVAANKRLQAMISSIAEEHDAKFNVVPSQFATDNGAMIAHAGCLRLAAGQLQAPEIHARPRWKLEDLPALSRV